MTILIATRNLHKVREIRTCLGEGFHFLTLLDYPDAPTTIDDQPTFAGNASKKATELAVWVQQCTDLRECTFVLADDSGLEVDALGGAPSVYSARFAALDTGGPGNSTDADNNAKLLRLLAGLPPEQRTARFRCVIALDLARPRPFAQESPCGSSPNGPVPTPALFEGVCEGRILDAPRGQSGFGYDPLFLPNGYAQTFAELGEETKNQISHRAQALQRLRQWLVASQKLAPSIRVAG